MECEHCTIEVLEGTGVDHELNENEVIVFCSMDHFKSWIDDNMDKEAKGNGDKDIS